MLQRGPLSCDHTRTTHKGATSDLLRRSNILQQRRRTAARSQSVPRRLHSQDFGKLSWQRFDVEGHEAAEVSHTSALAPRVAQSVAPTPSRDHPNSDLDQRISSSAQRPAAATAHPSEAYDTAVAALASAEAEANIELAASKEEAKQKRLQQKARRERILEQQELVELAGQSAHVAKQRLDARDARSRSYWVRIFPI